MPRKCVPSLSLGCRSLDRSFNLAALSAAVKPLSKFFASLSAFAFEPGDSTGIGFRRQARRELFLLSRPALLKPGDSSTAFCPVKVSGDFSCLAFDLRGSRGTVPPRFSPSRPAAHFVSLRFRLGCEPGDFSTVFRAVKPRVRFPPSVGTGVGREAG